MTTFQYRLNGDVEFCNGAEPSTTVCPFLPGQEVNLLEVPTEARTPRSLTSAVFTLDPQHKYRTLPASARKPGPATEGQITPRIPSQRCMQLSTGDVKKASQEDPWSLPKSSWKLNKDQLNSSGRAAYHRMRGTRSAEYQRNSKGACSLLNLRQKMHTSAAGTPEPLERATKSAYGSTVNAASLTTPSTNSKPLQGAMAEVYFGSEQLRWMPAKPDVPPNTPLKASEHKVGSGLAMSP